MKKLLSIIVILILLLSVNAFSASEELLVNSGFENGSTSGFMSYAGTSNMKVSSSYKHSGSYGLLMENRSGKYATCAQNVTDTLNRLGSGFYNISIWVRLKDENQIKPSCYVAIKLVHDDGKNKDEYLSGKGVTLSTSWQQITFSGLIAFDEKIGLSQALIYPQGYIGEESPDIMLDDFSFKLVKSIDTTPATDVSSVSRTSNTTVGAIRWDAWYAHDGASNSVISQVERSLSPAKFHFRAPFFAEITAQGKVIIPKYTQAIFDKEMEYAIEAGIDYFAYVWYNTDMKAARTFHTKSKYKNTVKMCVCFDGNAIGQTFARQELKTLLKEDYYMTVLDGRPLMFYLSSNAELVLKDIEYYRELCKEIGVKEPFAMVMTMPTYSAKAISCDGLSDYAISGASTYKNLTDKVRSTWDKHLDTGMQFIPAVSYGWHPEPRYINQVSWTTVQNNSWAEYATEEQLTDHLAYALSYLDHPKVQDSTKANTVLIYAWNEHDEGGWICPTLEVDKNGNQLYNTDGTKKINDRRVNATRLAVDFYKSGKRVSVSVNGVSNGSTISSASLYINSGNSSSPTATPKPSATASSSPSTPTPNINGTTVPTESPANTTQAPVTSATASPTLSPEVTNKVLTTDNGAEGFNPIPIIVSAGALVCVGCIAVVIIKKKK